MSCAGPDPKTASTKFRVLIVGGGVAGLEAALALQATAGELVCITLLAPERELRYRPMAVLEPFSRSVARGRPQGYPLRAIASDIGVTLRTDRFNWLDLANRVVHTDAGETVGYDALLLALGARAQPRFRHARTIDDRRLDEQMHGLIQDVDDGYIRHLAFLVPAPMPWPLPIYELALMTARRARESGREMSVTLATSEDAPLAIFGESASQAVARLLEQNEIMTITSAQCGVPAPGRVSTRPGARELHVDEVIALPQLVGPSVRGLPRSAAYGFISVDEHCRVVGLSDVYAAGDATDFAIKHGGIAAQQADTAAEAIAALAGATIKPSKFNPRLSAVLLGGDKPLYLSAHMTGRHGSSSTASYTPPRKPVDKVDARYLAPYLRRLNPRVETFA